MPQKVNTKIKKYMLYIKLEEKYFQYAEKRAEKRARKDVLRPMKSGGQTA